MSALPQAVLDILKMQPDAESVTKFEQEMKAETPDETDYLTTMTVKPTAEQFQEAAEQASRYMMRVMDATLEAMQGESRENVVELAEAGKRQASIGLMLSALMHAEIVDGKLIVTPPGVL